MKCKLKERKNLQAVYSILEAILVKSIKVVPGMADFCCSSNRERSKLFDILSSFCAVTKGSFVLGTGELFVFPLDFLELASLDELLSSKPVVSFIVACWSFATFGWLLCENVFKRETYFKFCGIVLNVQGRIY